MSINTQPAKRKPRQLTPIYKGRWLASWVRAYLECVQQHRQVVPLPDTHETQQDNAPQLHLF